MRNDGKFNYVAIVIFAIIFVTVIVFSTLGYMTYSLVNFDKETKFHHG